MEIKWKMGLKSILLLILVLFLSSLAYAAFFPVRQHPAANMFTDHSWWINESEPFLYDFSGYLRFNLSACNGSNLTYYNLQYNTTINITNITTYNITSLDGNASSICSGTDTYLDGEGNCDDISSIYLTSESDPLWTSNQSSYALITYVDSLGNWSNDINNYYNTTIIDSLGNWSYDEQYYYNKTEINDNNDTFKIYVDTQDSSQDECSEITGCVENAITSYENLTDSDISDFGYIKSYENLTPQDVVDYVGNWSADSSSLNNFSYSDIVSNVGNWSDDKYDYYNNTQVYNKTESDDRYWNEDGDAGLTGDYSGSYNISTTGNVSANTFFGDGSQLTGISSGGTSLWTNESGVISTDGKVNITDSATIGSGSNIASGDYSIALGLSTSATNDASFATGYITESSNFASTATGYDTTASGISSTATGYSTTASGDYSFSGGRDSTASGDYSTAMGHSTTASEESSTALGYSTTASGLYSTALGYGIEASGHSSVAIALNDQRGTTLSENAVMSIMGGKVGIGTLTPSSELEIDGEARLTDATDMGTNDASLATKKYVDDNKPVWSNESGYVVTDGIINATKTPATYLFQDDGAYANYAYPSCPCDVDNTIEDCGASDFYATYDETCYDNLKSMGFDAHRTYTKTSTVGAERQYILETKYDDEFKTSSSSELPPSFVNIEGEIEVTGISGDGTGSVVCIKSDGNLGTCTDQPDASGDCTCS